jgi:hypothetical protein
MPDLHATSLLKVAPEIAAMFRTDPVLAAFLDPAVHIEVDDEGHVTHKFVERLQLGLAASGLSMYDTLSHAWDPSFEAPALSLGRRHTNYHAFREFTLSVGVAAVLIWGDVPACREAEARALGGDARRDTRVLHRLVASLATSRAARPE